MWNVERRLQGSLRPGPGLNDLGIEQSKLTGKFLREDDSLREVDVICCSPLLRCRQTENYIRNELDPETPVEVWENLKERSLGDLEGCLWDNDVRNCIRQQRGVERIHDLESRAIGTLEKIVRRYRGKNIVVISHGGVLSALYSRLKPNERGSGSMSNCGVSSVRVEMKDGNIIQWEVVRWNYSDHLITDTSIKISEETFGGHSFG